MCFKKEKSCRCYELIQQMLAELVAEEEIDITTVNSLLVPC